LLIWRFERHDQIFYRSNLATVERRGRACRREDELRYLIAVVRA
jgi:hypothetical protein